MDLSIAIVSWNTRELLDQCLQSVFDTVEGIEVEAIVVDNASTDGSADMVAAKYPDVKLLRNRVNLGFAGACNTALQHSTGRYYLLLNSDTIVLGDALRSLMEFMDSHPEAGAAGSKHLNADGSLQRSCRRFPDLLTELYDALYLSKLFPKSRIFGSYSMSYWDFDETREVDFAGGSCLMVRREAIEEVGPLDEGYFMYTEEADWCYRLWQSGWKVYYYPGAQVIHLGGQSANRYGSDIHLHLYTSRNRFIYKHYGKAQAVAHRLIIALGAACRICAYGARHIVRRDMSAAVAFQLSVFRWSVGTPFAGRRAIDKGIVK